jgi:hypothetical protein
MLANRRNIVTEAVAFVFLFARKDIENPRRGTSEPCEHTFGGWRSQKSEPTVEETIWLEEKRERKVDAIYEGKLKVGRDPKKSGYGATWADFVSSDRDGNPKLNGTIGGDADVPIDDDNLVDSLWPHVMPIINECSNCMNMLLDRLGVDAAEKSPFLQQFQSHKELASVYKDHVFKSTSGSGDDYDNEEDEDGCSTSVQDTVHDPSDELNRIRELIDITVEDASSSDENTEDSGVAASGIEVTSDKDNGAVSYECAPGSNIASGWKSVVGSSLEDLAVNSRNGMEMLNTKSKGTINPETKRNH